MTCTNLVQRTCPQVCIQSHLLKPLGSLHGAFASLSQILSSRQSFESFQLIKLAFQGVS